MSEQRAVWELYAGDRLFGYVLWLGGQALLIDAEHRLRAQIRGWFHDRLGKDPEVNLAFVGAFFGDALPRHLPGARARQVDPETLPHKAWLRCLDRNLLVRGERDPTGSRSNRWERRIRVDELVQGTQEGRYRWSANPRGGFVAGGRTVDEEEVWLNLLKVNTRFLLVTRRGQHLADPPLVQRNGWLRRCALQRLYALIQRGPSA